MRKLVNENPYKIFKYMLNNKNVIRSHIYKTQWIDYSVIKRITDSMAASGIIKYKDRDIRSKYVYLTKKGEKIAKIYVELYELLYKEDKQK